MKKLAFVLSRPLSYAATNLLNDALTQAGIRNTDIQIVDLEDALAGRAGLGRFTCVVAGGDGASGACLPDLDWQRGWAHDRRGYLWEGDHGSRVLTTLDPEDCVLRHDPSGINAMLLAADLEKAHRESTRDHLHRRRHRISIVHDSAGAAAAMAAIRAAGYAACDIECTDSETLQCIGYGISAEEAYVFVGSAMAAGLELAADASVGKLFQNGQFDVYFLKTRCGVQVAGWVDDCMIAWHALWPEIAGKGKKGSKRTRKSLAFLASIYADSPEWWKCVEENTPVLTASFAWKPIKDIQVGEFVWGFDEFNEEGDKRRWRLAQVTAKQSRAEACVRVHTEHGFITCTPDHKLLVKTKSGCWIWQQAKDVKVGDTMRFVSEPVEASDDYDTGWMGGFADGEGSVRWDRHTNSGGAITLAQNVGPVLEYAKAILKRDGFNFGEYRKGKALSSVGITGGRSEWLRFLAKYQPLRLCFNTGKHLEGAVFSTTPSKVISVVKMSESVSVVDIATTTGTFIAAGYAVHNCYDTDDTGMYQLNGKDCCLTWEIMQNLRREIAEQNVTEIYQHEMSMMPVLVAIQERGLLVHDETRSQAIATLADRATRTRAAITAAAEPLLRERSDKLTKPHLFFGTRRCACCNGGAGKRQACWSCAGLASAPGKKQAAALNLQPCKVCDGAGKFETFEFNPASTAQQVELFYNVLGLPKRFNDGKLTADEKALKGLLAEINKESA